MADRISSPYVHFEESDRSFTAPTQGITTAAYIGPFLKGPAFKPTLVTRNTLTTQFGDTYEKFFTPYAVREYLRNAGSAIVVRTLWNEGYEHTAADGTLLSIDLGLANYTRSVALLAPTADNITVALDLNNSSKTELKLTVDNAGIPAIYTCSLNPSNDNYIKNVFGINPKGSEPVYCYKIFEDFIRGYGSTLTGLHTSSAAELDFTYTTGDQYMGAETPYVTSQELGTEGSSVKYSLFKFYTLSDGTNANTEVKVGIYNIKQAGTIAGSDYGEFSVTVRSWDDSDLKPSTLETFSGLNLDPNSPNYIARVIGDRYSSVDSVGKITFYGDYPNRSAFVRVGVTSAVDSGEIPVTAIPFGFKAPSQPVNGTGVNFPTASYKLDALDTYSEENSKIYFGFNYSNTDAHCWLSPIPEGASSGQNVDFNLSSVLYDDLNITVSSSLALKKFILPFQKGFDGADPAQALRPDTTGYLSAANVMGFDCSSAISTGTLVYRKAIDTISNKDEININMLVIPGLTITEHPAVVNYAETMVEDRADIFYPIDIGKKGTTVAAAVAAVEDRTSNYTAVYYPWVKIKDSNTNRYVWVPPSTVVGGAISYNDRIGYDWSAPAGFNRGGLPSVVGVENRLNKSERDDLYDARINPIASFPGEGQVIWGQKTLQDKPSALDRVNVRRLLINLKKYFNFVANRILFEQNIDAVRAQFYNTVNPYMEDIQQKRGLYTFKVILDESINTPDVIDRNMLLGEVWLQPSKTIEIIKIKFNITPTGADFEE